MRPEEVKEVEPHVSCIAAIRVPTTGIVDYRQVCHALVHEIQQQGGELKVGTEVLHIVPTPLGHLLETSWGSLETRFLINCAGLAQRPGSQAGRHGTEGHDRSLPR